MSYFYLNQQDHSVFIFQKICIVCIQNTKSPISLKRYSLQGAMTFAILVNARHVHVNIGQQIPQQWPDHANIGRPMCNVCPGSQQPQASDAQIPLHVMCWLTTYWCWPVERCCTGQCAINAGENMSTIQQIHFLHNHTISDSWATI